MGVSWMMMNVRLSQGVADLELKAGQHASILALVPAPACTVFRIGLEPLSITAN
jgi:hypothetical protein